MAEQQITTEEIDALPPHFRFSREVYGAVADDATRVLLALTDGGHGAAVTDEVRHAALVAALGFTVEGGAE